jgi:hypothetical protein
MKTPGNGTNVGEKSCLSGIGRAAGTRPMAHDRGHADGASNLAQAAASSNVQIIRLAVQAVSVSVQKPGIGYLPLYFPLEPRRSGCGMLLQ